MVSRNPMEQRPTEKQLRMMESSVEGGIPVRSLRWSFVLTLFSLLFLGLTVPLLHGIQGWSSNMRVMSGMFFFLAIITSGVLSLRMPPISTGQEGRMSRHDWSIAFLLVSVWLFGLSWIWPT
jgi:hypothetical protein